MINFYIADKYLCMLVQWCGSAMKSDLGDCGAIVSLLPGNALMMEDHYDVLGCKVREPSVSCELLSSQINNHGHLMRDNTDHETD